MQLHCHEALLSLLTQKKIRKLHILNIITEIPLWLEQNIEGAVYCITLFFDAVINALWPNACLTCYYFRTSFAS